MKQVLHCWQIVTDTNWKLDYHNIDSEDDDLTEDLFHAILKATSFEGKIVSVARIN